MNQSVRRVSSVLLGLLCIFSFACDSNHSGNPSAPEADGAHKKSTEEVVSTTVVQDPLSLSGLKNDETLDLAMKLNVGTHELTKGYDETNFYLKTYITLKSDSGVFYDEPLDNATGTNSFYLNSTIKLNGAVMNNALRSLSKYKGHELSIKFILYRDGFFESEKIIAQKWIRLDRPSIVEALQAHSQEHAFIQTDDYTAVMLLAPQESGNFTKIDLKEVKVSQIPKVVPSPNPYAGYSSDGITLSNPPPISGGDQ